MISLKRIVTLLISSGIAIGIVFPSILAEESPLKSMLPENDALILVKNVEFDLKRNGMERVLISLNRPAAINLFALDRDSPKVVADIQNVLEWKGSSKIQINGRCIKQIRIHLHAEQKKLRLVIDLLNPSREYIVSPVFYETDNIYSIEIKEK